MANTGVVVALVLAAAAFGGNWLWSRQTRKEQIERLVSGARAPDLLKEQSNVFNKKEIVQVTSNVYSAIGFAIANSIMIVGDDGIVIVDVTESVAAGREILAAFRNITSKPVKAIIYTHNHPDHTYGARGFIEKDQPTPEIWAHRSILSEFQAFFYCSPIGFQRALRQFGALTSNHINSGIGMKLRVTEEGQTSGLIYPTKMFVGIERDITVAGVNMKLVHIPGETPDQIGVWLPDQKVFLCADDVYRAFPNLYAIRGTKSRSLLDWTSSLDKIIDLEPHYLVPSHTRPLEGADAIMSLLTSYRDAIQFVHDQTVRFMNKGLLPDEIAAKVRLPEHLATHPYLIELYGTVEWSVKGVFNTYMGWFSGDPVDLSPLTPDELANRYVELGGGVDRCVTAAQEALDKGDHRWALTLASHVIRVDEQNTDARRIASLCMMALGNEQISSNGRNYFFTSALEVLGKVNTKIDGNRRIGLIRITPMATLFSLLRVRFMPETCSNTNTTVLFEFTDSNTFISLTVRNSIVFIGDRPLTSYQIKVKTTETVWREITISKMAALTSYATEEVEVVGGLVNFRNVMSCFERD
ncbi:alkyl/aryl-sulfatase BDS1-like [Haliotis rubra]|uniref:alkyl/aryl-sulfatase BDS1-like n=1 Tax=Haliotis rubra TaxID=36100 RepID=UPI001EE518D6|nr:alkyl/aryl-sulfatase BDS1-like [Haliotis rubra]